MNLFEDGEGEIFSKEDVARVRRKISRDKCKSAQARCLEARRLNGIVPIVVLIALKDKDRFRAAAKLARDIHMKGLENRVYPKDLKD